MYFTHPTKKGQDNKDLSRHINYNTKCPKFAGATLYQNGRLGNKMSSYTNLIILESIFGIKFFIPNFMKQYFGNIFKNVTYNSAPSVLVIIDEDFKEFVTNNLTELDNNGSVDCLNNPQHLLQFSGRHYVSLILPKLRALK